MLGILFFIFKYFIYLFLDRREGEREGGKHQRVVASHMPPAGDLAQSPGMCPDWESHGDCLVCRPVRAQSTELHQPRAKGLAFCIHDLI